MDIRSQIGFVGRNTRWQPTNTICSLAKNEFLYDDGESGDFDDDEMMMMSFNISIFEHF